MPTTTSFQESAFPRINRRAFLGTCAAGMAVANGMPLPALAAPEASLPPAPTAPLAMWALTGTLPSGEVCRQLDTFAGAGWGVVLYPRWGLELEYLGDAWFERIRCIAEQASARSVEVWLYDEFCWPSGHAKGLVTRDHEELAAQVLYLERDGTHRLERVPGAANLLMPEATRRFREVTHERYAAAVGEYFGSTIRALFTDEPSLAIQHQPRKAGDTSWRLLWSDFLGQALGNDFLQRLAAAGNKVADSPLWRDYWAAFSQVYHEAWTLPIARWCRDHRIAMSGHLLGEGSLGTQVGYYGSLRRQLGEFGIPGIDEINTRSTVDRCEALTLATIAEYPGRERMAEVFALGPCHMPMETMRQMVDLCAACGVDRYVMAICPFDLRGGVFKREYLGVQGIQQPWFRDYARAFADYLAQAASRARQASPLGISWPDDEELWAVAGPDPAQSKPLQEISRRLTEAAREAIRARLNPPVSPPVHGEESPQNAAWTFEPDAGNSLRIDGPALTVVDLPADAALSVQRQWVRSLRINGEAVDLAGAPADTQFDGSYCRVPVAGLLRVGENTFAVETAEAKPLRFLPAAVLWGTFAVDAQGRIVAPPDTIALGDWRTQGYPALCGIGRYRTTVDWPVPPSHLTVDSGGYPTRVLVNGRECGRRAWEPYLFDLRDAARAGSNELVVEIASTLGHLFVPREAPPIGLRGIRAGR